MRILAPVIALLAAGCVAIGPEVRDAQRVSEIVAEAVDSAQLSAELRGSTLARARQAFAEQPDEVNRLRLAALHATLPPPQRDDARATALLEPLAASSRLTPLSRFAALLAAQLAERQRMARDSERAARAGERREETLRQQVEALKAIERDIIKREERVRAGKR
ncbi:MAG: hypothetical protein ACREUO_02145 [Burkholderiales bacterium]